MTNNKAREINSPIIKQLINETTPEELAKIDTEMTNNKEQTDINAGTMKLSVSDTIYSNGSVVTDRKFGKLSSNGNIIEI
jgi:hypothetical protein